MKRIAAAVILICCLLAACSSNTLVTAGLSVELKNGAAVISWDKVENADMYRLYRCQPDEKDFKFIFDADTESMSYTDRYIEGSGTYMYKLEIIDGSGVSGVLMNSLNVPASSAGNKTENKTPDTPVITSVTAMDSYTAVVSVKPQENCTYEFYSSDSADGSYELVSGNDEPVLYYENKNENIDRYFRVRAVSGKYKSEMSEPQKTGFNEGTVFNVPVLMYHEFVTDEDLKAGIAFDEYAIYADEFENDLKWLKDEGYTAITCSQLADYLSGEGSMPEKPVMLTIDDGKYGVYKRAWPLLKKYKMKAVLAVIGQDVDNATMVPGERKNNKAPFCTWDEIREMQKSGEMEIISHTDKLHAYHNSGRIGASTMEDDTMDTFLPIAQKDHANMTQSFKKHLETKPEALAYPYSERTVLSDKAWLKSGYRLLLAGNKDTVRVSRTNYFVREAGLNSKSSLIRRVARMTGHPAKECID